MGRYTVIVSQRADAMLVRHTRFLANVSIPAAKRLVAEFRQVVDSLDHPNWVLCEGEPTPQPISQRAPVPLA